MIMKKLLLSLIVAAMPVLASAQNIFDSSDNHKYFGVRLGLDLTCPTKVTDHNAPLNPSTDIFNTGAGFNAGVIYNIPVWMNMYVEPGLNFYYHTYKVDKDLLPELDSKYTNASVREFGLSIPVVAGYHFDFTDDVKVRVFTGPVFSLGLKGNFHVTDKTGDIEMNGSEGVYKDGGVNRSNIAWRLGAGIDYKQFAFAVYGDPELTHAYHNSKGSNIVFRRNVVSFTFGYNF